MKEDETIVMDMGCLEGPTLHSISTGDLSDEVIFKEMQLKETVNICVEHGQREALFQSPEKGAWCCTVEEL
jgi:hypothetical protein